MTTAVDRDQKLQAFAEKHSVRLEKKGEVGMGRAAVGFLHGNSYVAFHPMNMKTYETVEGFDEDDDRLYAPQDVEAYHKANCLCVLVTDGNFEKALDGLMQWVEHLETQGEIEIVMYVTGAVGLQAAVTGATGYAIRFKK